MFPLKLALVPFLFSLTSTAVLLPQEAAPRLNTNAVGYASGLWDWVPYKEHFKSTVLIRIIDRGGNKYTGGTGVVIFKDLSRRVQGGHLGYVLTADHVSTRGTPNTTSVVYFNGKKSKKVSVLWSSNFIGNASLDVRDLSLLYVWIPDEVPEAKITSKKLRVDEPLDFVGFGGCGAFRCIRHHRVAPPHFVIPKKILSDTFVVGGDSGGTTYNSRGEVVSILSAGTLKFENIPIKMHIPHQVGRLTVIDASKTSPGWPAYSDRAATLYTALTEKNGREPANLNKTFLKRLKENQFEDIAQKSHLRYIEKKDLPFEVPNEPRMIVTYNDQTHIGLVIKSQLTNADPKRPFELKVVTGMIPKDILEKSVDVEDLDGNTYEVKSIKRNKRLSYLSVKSERERTPIKVELPSGPLFRDVYQMVTDGDPENDKFVKFDRTTIHNQTLYFHSVSDIENGEPVFNKTGSLIGISSWYYRYLPEVNGKRRWYKYHAQLVGK